MKRALYLTTTLPYVNAPAHIGFALELVQADIIARYRALCGDDIFFNTGTDEHGLKVFRKAQEEGKDTKVYTDEYAAKFRSLKEKLNLHPDLHFIRTTDPNHKKAAQEMWRRCDAAGDIYKKKYKGLYCIGDEAFIKESELVNGKCPNHPSMKPVEVEEENYFFRLSNYGDKLLEYLSREDVIVPEWRREEAIRFVKDGLEDFSISREKSRLPWGVTVPGDDSQVLYVWFDALTNYISTLGWPDDKDGLYKKFWEDEDGETLQLAGKDQIRFQSIMWQAMLMSAGLPTTDCVVYHGFITSGRHKMSKSLGNVIDPLAIVDEYGVDALRYFLARHVHPFEDSDFTMERFKKAYNADLANGLGNFVSRVMKLSEQYVDNISSSIGFYDFQELEKQIDSPATRKYFSALDDFNFNVAVDAIWEEISFGDQLMVKDEVFKRLKTETVAKEELAKNFVQRVWRIATMIEPLMPLTSRKIKDAVRQNKKPENIFPRKE